MSSWGLSWLTSWAQSWGSTGGGDQHGHAGPSLVVKRRPLIQRKKMMRALLMARR